MRITVALFALVVGAIAGDSGGSGDSESKTVISETTILNRIITSLKVFDEALEKYNGGPTHALKTAAADLAYTLESQTVVAHEIGSLTIEEATQLKDKSEELHAAGGSFLKDLAAVKGKLDRVGASPKVYYYLTFKLSKSSLRTHLVFLSLSTCHPYI